MMQLQLRYNMKLMNRTDWRKICSFTKVRKLQSTKVSHISFFRDLILTMYYISNSISDSFVIYSRKAAVSS